MVFLDCGAILLCRTPQKRSQWGTEVWQKYGATVQKTFSSGKSSKYGCHTFVDFGRWQQPVNDGNTNTYSNNFHSCSSNLLLIMGISSGKCLNEDDNAIIAVLLAQEVKIFEKFLKKPVGDDANGPVRQYRKVFSRPNYKESVWWMQERRMQNPWNQRVQIIKSSIWSWLWTIQNILRSNTHLEHNTHRFSECVRLPAPQIVMFWSNSYSVSLT